MAWTVMRRDLERNVRVAICGTEAEAVSFRRETERTHPNEDSWIECDEPQHRTLTPVARPTRPSCQANEVPPPQPSSQANEVPKARVVSRVERTKPRRVPWLAVVYMIGPTYASIAGALLTVAFLCMQADRHGHSLNLFSPGTAHVLEVMAMVWIGIVAIVVVAIGAYEWAFLRHARLVEGVTKNEEIEIAIDGGVHRMSSIAPSVPEGTRVPLFVRGLRVVELCKAGARLGADGEVCWDAVAYPYKSAQFQWPIALAVGITAMLLTLILAALRSA